MSRFRWTVTLTVFYVVFGTLCNNRKFCGSSPVTDNLDDFELDSNIYALDLWPVGKTLDDVENDFSDSESCKLSDAQECDFHAHNEELNTNIDYLQPGAHSELIFPVDAFSHNDSPIHGERLLVTKSEEVEAGGKRESKCSKKMTTALVDRLNAQKLVFESRRLRQRIYQLFAEQIGAPLRKIYDYEWENWPQDIDKKKHYWTRAQRAQIESVLEILRFVAPSIAKPSPQSSAPSSKQAISPENVILHCQHDSEQRANCNPDRKHSAHSVHASASRKDANDQGLTAKATAEKRRRVEEQLVKMFTDQNQRSSRFMRQYIWVNWPAHISKYKRSWTSVELKEISDVLDTIIFEYPTSQDAAVAGNCEPSNIAMYTWTREEAYTVLLKRFRQDTDDLAATKINWSRANTSQIPSRYQLKNLMSMDFKAAHIFKNPEIFENIHFTPASIDRSRSVLNKRKLLKRCQEDLGQPGLKRIPWKRVDIIGCCREKLVRKDGYTTRKIPDDFEALKDIHFRLKDPHG